MRAEEEEEREWRGINRWNELPTPDELMPLSQSLITPDLALAFDIPTPHNPSPPPPPPAAIDGGEEPARTLKRPRLVWTPQLHKRFVDAVAHLGIKNAVPKTIMQLMSVDGLTRENVASHLQKYRLYLKRMQGLGSSSSTSAADLAADRLFASSPVPHHFLARSAPDPHFVPYQQYYPQLGQFRGFDHPFVPRAPPMHRVAMPMVPPPPPIPYSEELDSGAGGARKVLTLFPTGED